MAAGDWNLGDHHTHTYWCKCFTIREGRGGVGRYKRDGGKSGYHALIYQGEVYKVWSNFEGWDPPPPIWTHWIWHNYIPCLVSP